MEKLTYLLLLLVSALVGVIQCLSNEPLYLTKYIENNRIEEGKAAAYVTHYELLSRGLRSYSGFFTVNKTYNSNLFFWFFRAKNNPSTAPVLLWLQGGPGASSLYGLYMENGPMQVVNSNGKLESRPCSWQEDHNVIYMDSPVGTGWSFTDNIAGYARKTEDYAADLYSAVKQFFQLFPELRGNKFFITGESYAGKYIPALGNAIYQKRLSTDVSDRINLQGIAIGNGVTDPVHQILFGEYFYQLGFIDKNALAIFNQLQAAALNSIASGDYLTALKYTFAQINSQYCLFNNLTGYTSSYNYLRPDGYQEAINWTSNYMLNSDISKSLHVGNKPFVAFSETNVVINYLLDDIMRSVAPFVETLANNYRVLIYNGQLDLLVGTTNTENYLSYLSYNGASEFSKAPRFIWRERGRVVGSFKTGGNLTLVNVFNAGHLVPRDQPENALAMIKKFTFGNGF